MEAFKRIGMVGARPMTLGEYHLFCDWNTPPAEDTNRQGYLVRHGASGPLSWLPKEMFEEDYLPCGSPEERMSVELTELKDRIQKLEKFFGLTDAALIVGKEQYDLMVKQLNSMRMYRGFLVERKELMCKNQ